MSFRMFGQLFSLILVQHACTLESTPSGRNAEKDPSKHWPNATIPFEIIGPFTHDQKKVLHNAFRFYEDMTCLRFVPYADQKNHLVIESAESGCVSTVGMVEPHSTMFLSDLCFERYASILHELMHVMGFHHEHTRPDRDDYIDIDHSNIRTKFAGNFEKRESEETETFGVPYDYNSIMHYGKGAFARDGTETITAKSTKHSEEMGQRLGPSNYDLSKIIMLYCSQEYQDGQHPFKFYEG